MATIEQIDDFSRFAKKLLEQEGAELPFEVLLDRWYREASATEDLLAIQASVRDYQNGERGQLAEGVLAEFRARRSTDKNS